MKVCLFCNQRAIVFFDFEVAFPSISQDFLLDVMDRLGLPGEITQVIKALLFVFATSVVIK